MNRRKQPEVYDLLYQLGVTANYTGFFHTAYAISLCVEQPDRLLLVTKWLYPEVAKQYGTNWKAVERNIRTVSCIIWREGRPLLEELAHRHLEQKPRNAQMLAILASSLDTGSLAVHGLGEAVALAVENDDVGVVDEPIREPNRSPAKRVAWGEEEGMERVEFSPQAGTKQSGISSDEMEHKPGESLCKLPFPALQNLDHRCGEIVKSQPGRYSADVLKDPFQPFQQTFLVL